VTRAHAVAVVALGAFMAIAVLISRDRTPGPDAGILRLVPPSNDPDRLSRVCDAFVLAGIALGAIFITVVLLTLIVRKEWRPALFWLLTFAGVAVLDVGLKAAFRRPPISDASDGYSFPSGNAMASIALVLAVGTLVPGSNVRHSLAVVGAVVVILYGAALVYLSWHYPSDVVAGWSLSLAWVSFLGFVIRPGQVLTPTRRRSAREPPFST
jgi:membrane-associated phospholipid phosphatase